MSIRNYLLALTLLLSPAAQAVDFRSEVGVGIQYGGVIGYQASLHSHRNSINYSIGLLGSSLGYEFAATEKISLGIQTLAIRLEDVGFSVGVGVHINYHLSSVSTSGWIFGLDIYDVGTASDEDEDDNGSVESGALISVGYRF